jgi:hypothetical protein
LLLTTHLCGSGPSLEGKLAGETLIRYINRRFLIFNNFDWVTGHILDIWYSYVVYPGFPHVGPSMSLGDKDSTALHFILDWTPINLDVCVFSLTFLLIWIVL